MGAVGPDRRQQDPQPERSATTRRRTSTPISLYASLPNVVVVSTKLPINSARRARRLRAQEPQTFRTARSATAARSTWPARCFEQLAGAKMQHVPYRVTSQLQADLIAGSVPVSFQLLPNVVGGDQERPGARRSPWPADKRLAALPDVPTAAEAGLKGFESAAWFGFLAPRGTPQPVIDRLNREIVAAVADPAVRARFTDFGAEPITSTPEEFGALHLRRSREVARDHHQGRHHRRSLIREAPPLHPVEDRRRVACRVRARAAAGRAARVDARARLAGGLRGVLVSAARAARRAAAAQGRVQPRRRRRRHAEGACAPTRRAAGAARGRRHGPPDGRVRRLGGAASLPPVRRVRRTAGAGRMEGAPAAPAREFHGRA